MQGPYARRTNKDSSNRSNIEGTPGTAFPPKKTRKQARNRNKVRKSEKSKKQGGGEPPEHSNRSQNKRRQSLLILQDRKPKFHAKKYKPSAKGEQQSLGSGGQVGSLGDNLNTGQGR
jgi:hypothetical protein